MESRRNEDQELGEKWNGNSLEETGNKWNWVKIGRKRRIGWKIEFGRGGGDGIKRKEEEEREENQERELGKKGLGTWGRRW